MTSPTRASGTLSAAPRAPDAEVEETLGLERGSCLGSYQLVLPIASGGMGRVWIAARRGDFGFQRMFAVKVMREELAKNTGFRRMFLDEAKLAARLRHSNILEVLDLGEVDGTVYQAMPLVDGDSLAGLVARDARRATRMPIEIAGRIIVDVLRGLHAAHELKDDNGMPLHLVHRDVSPGNILVGLDGLSKIADFGVAKAIGLTQSSGVVGKRSYMAPEQLLGAELDRRSDVFAAGVVLWELLAGCRAGAFGPDLLANRTIASPRSKRGDVHEGLAAIAMRALEQRPEDRYPSADAMADAIERAAFDSGIALSAKTVSAWVSELVGARSSQLRDDARREFEVSQAIASGVETLTSAPPVTTGHRHPRARPLFFLLAGLLLAALVSVVVITATRRHTDGIGAAARTPDVRAAEPPAAVSAAPSADAPAERAATSLAAATPARSTQDPATPPSGPHRSPRRVQGRRSPSAPTPAYDNPY